MSTPPTVKSPSTFTGAGKNAGGDGGATGGTVGESDGEGVEPPEGACPSSASAGDEPRHSDAASISVRLTMGVRRRPRATSRRDSVPRGDSKDNPARAHRRDDALPISGE
ncbi:MAG: hypothetical protein LBK72_01400 [Bifidobacteriaceae bacterium]|nr:hypothetical protein [Bifidobacteriaceae bacterium]